MQKYSNKFFWSLSIIIIGIIFGLVVGLVKAAWVDPTESPPNGNLPAPINVGGALQTKTGALVLNKGLLVNTDNVPYGLIVATGDVGIGTLEPSYKLDVAGALRLQPTSSVLTASEGVIYYDSTAKRFKCYENGAWTNCTGGGGGGGGVSGSGSVGQVTFWASSTSVGGDKNLFWDNANKRLGIGTTTPTASLEVVGQIKTTEIKITGGSPGAGKVLTSDASGLASWQTLPPGSLPSGTSGQTLRHDGTNWVASSLLFNNGTNVGIGTTNPSSKLDVSGDINVSGVYRKGGTAGISVSCTSSTTPSGITISGGIVTSAGSCTSIGGGGGGGISGSGTTNYISKWTDSTSLGSSIIYDNGTNVGIGTNSPTALSGSQKTLHISDTTNGAGIRLTGAEGISGGMAIGGSKSVGMAVGTVTNHALQFYTNSSERMRIDTSGNVGIGTTTPVNSNLHVYAPTGYATIRIESGGKGTGTSPLLAFKNKDDPVGWTIGQDSWYSNAFSIQRDANPWPRYFLITQAGSVGIGTTNPAGPLHVHSNSSQGAIYISGVSDNGHTYSAIYLNNETADTNNDWVISHRKEVGSDMEGDLHIGRWTNSTYRLDIDIDKNTGNVGIGKTDPAYKLDVAGDIRTTGCLVYNGGSLGICVSDIRLKDNITDLSFNNALAKVLSLQPKQFTLKNDPLQKISGLIAQEVEQFAPELVVTDEKGYKQIKYGDVQWLLIEAIKEQQKEIEELKAKF